MGKIRFEMQSGFEGNYEFIGKLHGLVYEMERLTKKGFEKKGLGENTKDALKNCLML